MVAVTRSTSPAAGQSPASDAPRKHTVKAGDTMFSIAKNNGLSLDELTRANPQVRDPARIRVGQELNVPVAEQAAGAQAAAGSANAVAGGAAPGAVQPATGQAAANPESVPANPADAATVQGARARARAADQGVRARLDAQTPASTGPARSALTSTGTLSRNDEGPAVTELQQQLNARGATLKVDGDFGPETRSAVRDFQRQNGLTSDGIVGPDTRGAFAATATPQNNAPANGAPANGAPVDGVPAQGGGQAPVDVAPTPGVNAPAASNEVLRSGSEGPAVEALQTRLNTLIGAGLQVDGDFGRNTRTAVENFQRRAGLEVDGEVGAGTRTAMDEVAAGTRQLAAPAANTSVDAPARPDGPRSRTITAEGNTFRAHDMYRSEFGTRSVPGNRIISMDANSVSGREGEILRPLVIIPNNATPAERQAAQASVDRVAQWLADNNPGQNRATTGLVRTTAENGRGLGGFFHTEFHSVNDTDAVNLIRERPQEYARILADTLGAVPGANFIVPHGNKSRYGRDPGAVAVNGTTEVGIAQGVIRNGFFALGGGQPSV
jgi:peptidoglycan hydrolase-like protein with peptidoglycan-binding domain